MNFYSAGSDGGGSAERGRDGGRRRDRGEDCGQTPGGQGLPVALGYTVVVIVGSSNICHRCSSSLYICSGTSTSDKSPSTSFNSCTTSLSTAKALSSIAVALV